MIKRVMVLAMGLMLLPVMAMTATINVPADQPTIQAGINAAADGDTVLVAPGTYLENIRFYGKRILLSSETGRESTYIEAADPWITIVQFIDNEDSTSVIAGFTVRNASLAYGILCRDASPIIRDCDISYCSYWSDGTGIFLVRSSAKIRYNRIHHNIGANTGGGIGGTEVNNGEICWNEIYDNTAPHGPGIGLHGVNSNVRIHHNLIYNNIGENWVAGGIYINGNSCRIYNNTLSGNTEGITLLDGSGTDIRNNIVVRSTLQGISAQAATSNYNNVWNNGSANNPGPDGISKDPLFLNTPGKYFVLSAVSPCIDAGDPDAAYNDPDGSRNDIGTYYYANTAPSSPVLVEPANTTIMPLTTLRPQFVWRASVDTGDVVTYFLVIADDSNFTVVRQISDLVDTSYIVVDGMEWGKKYWWKVKASDLRAAETWSEQQFTFRTMTLGDANNDAVVDLVDIIFLINYIFMGGNAPQPLMAGDSNCDGRFNIADVVYLINYVFREGKAPCSDL
jgi:parallel beta-helix repeat protein